MSLVKVTIPASSLHSERIDSQIAIGTASGNLWCLSKTENIEMSDDDSREIQIFTQFSDGKPFVNDWTIY